MALNIINTSIEFGVYPKKFKITKMIPVYNFKSDDETDPINYWPVSLLSGFNKILKN